MSPRLAVELERAHHRPGETVRGVVIVSEGGRSRGLDVRLEYREQSPDYIEVARTIPGTRLVEGDLSASQRLPFALELPGDALPSLASAHGTLSWVVVARCDERGFDTIVVERFRVLMDEQALEAEDEGEGRARTDPRGSMPGRDLLDEPEAEHRAEIERDERRLEEF